MTLTDTFSTSLSGLNAATSRLNDAAVKIATWSTQSTNANGVADSFDDLAGAMVQMTLAKLMYKANATVIRAADEMTGTLLNIKA